MPSQKHSELVQLGAKWFRRNGFGVIATELRAIGCREEADVIGFRSSCSAIIEVKISRSDFIADRKKPERLLRIGLGVYRFYLVPSGLLLPQEIPSGWGLLFEDRGKVTDIIRPRGNIWYGYSPDKSIDEGWRRFQHQANLDAERHILYSIARRKQQLRRKSHTT
jgi:hypothetical protein